MINPCRDTSKARLPMIQIRSRIMIETNADARLFELLSLPCRKRAQSDALSGQTDRRYSYFLRE
jgi:hypothetical protein